MPKFEEFLNNEENALFAQMARKDGNDPVYDAAVDTAIKWQAIGFRERAKKFAKNLLSSSITDTDEDALFDKVIERAKIVSACLSL